MNLTLSIVLLIVGLILLWKSGGWSVTNAIRFSYVFHIESFVIGFFIFALSTGLPEITSAIVSSLEKVPELSGGDLMGSTFVNLTLLLGISIIIAKNLPVEAILRKRLILSMSLILLIMAMVAWIDGYSLILGIIFLSIYLFSFLLMRNSSKENFKKEVNEAQEKVKLWVSNPKIDVLLKLGVSLALLVFSSWITVLSAVDLAKFLEIPVMIVGGTIVAIGTGLPELTLEIHAIRKKEYGLALGDIFGSSLVNVSFVLGLLMISNPSFDLSIAKPILFFLIPAAMIIFYRLIQKRPFNILNAILLLLIFILYLMKISYSLNTVTPLSFIGDLT